MRHSGRRGAGDSKSVTVTAPLIITRRAIQRADESRNIHCPAEASPPRESSLQPVSVNIPVRSAPPGTRIVSLPIHSRRLRPLEGKPAGSLVVHEIYRSLQG